VIAAAEAEGRRYAVTDGEIAVLNLEGSRRRSWDRWTRDPALTGAAERLVEEEQRTLQFLGESGALDRLEMLADTLGQLDPDSARTALVQAQVASASHRFADARRHLARAEAHDDLCVSVERLRLGVDQACGDRLDATLDARRRLAAQSDSLEDLVPLAALLADLREFDEADRVYRRALETYGDVSPFDVAWACFQLGVLWGELVSEPHNARAAAWYGEAIACVPAYTKARVHLAEILLHDGEADAAEALLRAALARGDPEVRWRLADALALQGKRAEAQAHLTAARSGFERLLERHLLAFADHGAEFYLGSGNDPARASELARLNLANRPTARAYALHAQANDRYGGRSCPIAEHS
jgi:tetratricopeptide (TPR) repeat protein